MALRRDRLDVVVYVHNEGGVMQITIDREDGTEPHVFAGVFEFALVGSQVGPQVEVPIFLASHMHNRSVMVGLCEALEEHVRTWQPDASPKTG